ncbi:alpha/beta hydrolase [Prosthecochloris sp. N3]|uniref:Alpha/beta hydrolase n=1 Tax=Prosthecochloris ethylica TaxID=2743976 RepID=A0ABR9XQS4_9CHLB|nr:alpha/beta hydrolase [Prosthecochloris ethylica]MBF0585456.1 alpha/beta hydrolase [Prosthecochloris ethylica]MBF0636242.1 alpha/beta hydrolase [Prosthecochloris ethylica]NUK46686.1 alpha/beta hydrolase [Prosthecochloris ethylica]
MNTTCHTIVLQGHRHRYLDTETDGPPLLLLHGISCSLDIFDDVIGPLSASFRVLALDLLGFGDSAKPQDAPYSLRLYADLITEFIQRKTTASQAPPYVIGHSMGGKYALATALLHPGLFSGLVLSNTDGFTRLPFWVRAISWPVIRQFLKSLMTSRRVSARAFRAAFASTARVNPESFTKNLERTRDKAAVETVMQLNRNYRELDLEITGLRDRLSELALPVLILWGEHDRYISPSTAVIAQQELPGSKLVMFPECGHTPMLEYPREFTDTVTRFFLNS